MSLYVTEVVRLATDYTGQVVMALNAPPLRTQILAIGGSLVPSLPFQGATRFIRLYAEAKCWIVTANAGQIPDPAGVGWPMPAEAVEYIGVAPGMSLAVIAL